VTLDTFFNRKAIPPGVDPRTGAKRIIRGGRRFRFSRLTLFAITLAISGRAGADTLSGPYTALRVNTAPGVFNNVSGSAAGEIDSFSSGGDPADNNVFSDSASASVQLFSKPYLNTTVSGTGAVGVGYDFAVGSLIYDLEVTGPIPLLPVPVLVSGSMITTFDSGSDYDVEGAVQFIDDDPSTDYLASICPLTDNPPVLNCDYSLASPGQYQSFTHLLFYSTGDVQAVELFAAVSLVAGTGGDFYGSVTVDPTFAIDPAFLAENPGYSLEFSNGVGNTPDPPSDTPEPATWATMLVGFGGLGALLRRSRGFRRSS